MRQAPRRALEVALSLDEGELHPQQLVEDEPAAGHLLVGHRVGRVDTGEGLGAAHQVVAVEHPVGHRVGQPARAARRSSSATQSPISHVDSRAFSDCG